MPDQFWNLEPREFQLIANGYYQRQKDIRYMKAWMVSLLRNPHLKRSAQKTPEQLLGIKKKKKIKDTKGAAERLNEWLPQNKKTKEVDQKQKEEKAREVIKMIMEKRKKKIKNG